LNKYNNKILQIKEKITTILCEEFQASGKATGPQSVRPTLPQHFLWVIFVLLVKSQYVSKTLYSAELVRTKIVGERRETNRRRDFKR
jgi:hypothetical protein